MNPNTKSFPPAQDALGLTKIHEVAGNHVQAALLVSASRDHVDPDLVFNNEISSAISAVRTLPTQAEQYDVCYRFIGALTGNLVKKLSENFIAAIFLALIFLHNLHAHLLGTHPELKRRREFECYILAQWGISKSEGTISRLCRAGQRALEALAAGLPIPSRPNPLIAMLPLWDDFLPTYKRLCADAGGKVPATSAIDDCMDTWKRKAKKNANPPTVLERIAAEKRAIREALSAKRVDTEVIAQASANLDALYRALDEAASAVGVRKKAAPPPKPADAPAAPALEGGAKASPAADPTAGAPAAEADAATRSDGSIPVAEPEPDDEGNGSITTADAQAIADSDSPVSVGEDEDAAPAAPAATDFVNGVALELRGTQVLAVLTTINRPLFKALRERMTNPDAPYRFKQKEMCRGGREPGAWIRDYGDTTQSTAAYHELVSWARDFGHPPS